jgi:hypothetical protein
VIGPVRTALRRLLGDASVRRYGTRGIEQDTHFAVELLRRRGADLAVPREVRHFVHVADTKAARRVVAEAAALGLTGDVLAGDADKPLPATALLTHEIVVSAHALLGWRSRLSELAERHAGEYDGWEASPEEP